MSTIYFVYIAIGVRHVPFCGKNFEGQIGSTQIVEKNRNHCRRYIS